MRRLDDNIYLDQLQINHLKLQLDTLKQNYAKNLVFAYKNRSNYDYLNFIFSATSFNDAIKRVAYLRSYRQYRETQVTTIQKTQSLITAKIDVLNSNKVEKRGALTEQSKQLNVLQDDRKEQNQVVAQLKGKESEIASQIESRQRSQQKYLTRPISRNRGNRFAKTLLCRYSGRDYVDYMLGNTCVR